VDAGLPARDRRTSQCGCRRKLAPGSLLPAGESVLASSSLVLLPPSNPDLSDILRLLVARVLVLEVTQGASDGGGSNTSSAREDAEEGALLRELWQASPSNQVCADCGRPSPSWASINLGLLCWFACLP
jgi:hypothetical protein